MQCSHCGALRRHLFGRPSSHTPQSSRCAPPRLVPYPALPCLAHSPLAPPRPAPLLPPFRMIRAGRSEQCDWSRASGAIGAGRSELSDRSCELGDWSWAIGIGRSELAIRAWRSELAIGTGRSEQDDRSKAIRAGHQSRAIGAGRSEQGDQGREIGAGRVKRSRRCGVCVRARVWRGWWWWWGCLMGV